MAKAVSCLPPSALLGDVPSGDEGARLRRLPLRSMQAAVCPRMPTASQEHESKGAASSSDKRPRTLKPRVTDTQVDRAIKDNMAGWPSSWIDGRVVNGMTLRERLAADKRAARTDKSMKLGARLTMADACCRVHGARP